MTPNQPVRVVFDRGTESEFIAHGTIRQVGADVILVEFPPIDQSVILDSNDPAEVSDAEDYALKCSSHADYGRVWCDKARVLEGGQ